MRAVLRDYAVAVAVAANNGEAVHHTDREGVAGSVPRNPRLCYKDASVHVVDRLTACGAKGWASALLSHGANFGAWYFELTVEDTRPPEEQPNTRRKTHHHQQQENDGTVGAVTTMEPAVRVGWGLRYSRLDTPLGCDNYSVSLRDRDGSVVFGARRRPCAVGFRGGDVVGCALLLHASPKGEIADPRRRPELHSFVQNGLLCNPARPPSTFVHPTAAVLYTVNGQLFEPALLGELPAGRWHPGVSVFGGARATLNLGPDFVYQPPSVPVQLQEASGCAAFSPACELPAPPF